MRLRPLLLSKICPKLEIHRLTKQRQDHPTDHWTPGRLSSSLRVSRPLLYENWRTSEAYATSDNQEFIQLLRDGSCGGLARSLVCLRSKRTYCCQHFCR